MTANKTPRGIRNCNPLNLIKTDTLWLGKVIPGTDPKFEQFTHMVYGVRAAMINVRTLCKRRQGLTIRGLIEIWAPPFENHTEIYITRVCRDMGVKDSLKINWRDKKMMCSLMMAMTFVECGCTIEPQIYERAFEMI